jgi:phage terminase large subunit-like protein
VAHRFEDGRVAVRARVWSARQDAAHHVYVAGGRIQNVLVEGFIADELAERYTVREVVFDPRFFDDQAERLSARGLQVIEFAQQSEMMRGAEQRFYAAATGGTISHDGDRMLAQHVEATAAQPTERGWRVYKLRSASPIDACTAAIMARERAAHEERPPKSDIIWLEV